MVNLRRLVAFVHGKAPVLPYLDDDVLRLILEHCSLRVSRICKRWYRLSHQRTVYRLVSLKHVADLLNLYPRLSTLIWPASLTRGTLHLSRPLPALILDHVWSRPTFIRGKVDHVIVKEFDLHLVLNNSSLLSYLTGADKVTIVTAKGVFDKAGLLARIEGRRRTSWVWPPSQSTLDRFHDSRWDIETYRDSPQPQPLGVIDLGRALLDFHRGKSGMPILVGEGEGGKSFLTDITAALPPQRGGVAAIHRRIRPFPLGKTPALQVYQPKRDKISRPDKRSGPRRW